MHRFFFALDSRLYSSDFEAFSQKRKKFLEKRTKVLKSHLQKDQWFKDFLEKENSGEFNQRSGTDDFFLLEHEKWREPLKTAIPYMLKS